MHTPELLALWQWDEETFDQRLQGSPIRRIGHECWLRNIAVALGNAQADAEVIEALEWRSGQVSEMVQEHIDWALDRQRSGAAQVTQQLKRLVRAVSKGLPRDA